MSRFTSIVMEHFQEPRNRGPLPDKTHLGVVGTPGAGPFFVLNLKVEDHKIAAATFDCNACGATIASGSVLTEWLIGKSVKESAAMTAAQLADLLGGLPLDKQHCTVSAVQALQQAFTPEFTLANS
ncbi:iron-sulfur cluster assembly scaffold protein [Planctomicrobium sp. SH664]|uniref:iron-sulfur cluster assembly scaffold protein n=1 Tax=Planctomicrobium sp. SH664 TaxID=3448125 RepID=UPI003F5AF02E